jgi:hypothetical protein
LGALEASNGEARGTAGDRRHGPAPRPFPVPGLRVELRARRLLDARLEDEDAFRRWEREIGGEE